MAISKRDSSLKDEERLDKFIRQFELSRGVGSDSYAAYLRIQGKPATALYQDAVTTANRRYDRALSGYGTNAETLAAMGGASGYAAYLNRAAAQSLAADKKEAVGLRADIDRENESGYAAYLSTLSNKLRTTVDSMRAQQIRQYNDAYAYTLAAGFDNDTAHLAANLVEGMESKPLSATEKNIRMRLLREMIDLSLPRDAAYNYAMSCGIDAEAAAELADMCASVLGGHTQIPIQ